MVDREALQALGIDAEEGLAYCADDPEFYEEMLAEYASEAEAGLSELERFFETRSWDRYGIRAHTAKSTSRMIGAQALSEEARALEMAAKEGDEAAVLARHEAFMSAYRGLMLGLQAILADR